MRFEIGQQVLFINVKYHKKDNVPISFSSLFDPRIHELEDIEVKVLTVKEHHKVPSCYEPNGNKEYDGFIFTEKVNDCKEQLWHNQYPTAVYGQLSDDNDRKVRRHSDFNIQEIEELSEEEITKWMENWYTALDFISTIKRAIDGGKKYGIELSVEDKKLFEDYLSEVQKTIEEASGKKVNFNNATYKSKDGSIVEMENYWEASLV